MCQTFSGFRQTPIYIQKQKSDLLSLSKVNRKNFEQIRSKVLLFSKGEENRQCPMQVFSGALQQGTAKIMFSFFRICLYQEVPNNLHLFFIFRVVFFY